MLEILQSCVSPYQKPLISCCFENKSLPPLSQSQVLLPYIIFIQDVDLFKNFHNNELSIVYQIVHASLFSIHELSLRTFTPGTYK